MQERNTAQRGGAAFIWKWGAIYGVILGMTQIIMALLALPHRAILYLLIWLIGFFLIGMFAARRTGRIGTGTLVGLVTGLISALLVVLFGIIQITGNNPQITQALNQAALTAQQRGRLLSPTEIRILAIVGSLLVLETIELSLGAGIGSLGGLLGRRQPKPLTN